MRKYGRRDNNHADIRKALRDIGWKVQDLGGQGQGCPDLLVGAFGINVLLEVKGVGDEDDLTPDERDWHVAWLGQADVVSSAEDAIAAVIRLAREYGRIS
jgi:hypothetical protein